MPLRKGVVVPGSIEEGLNKAINDSAKDTLRKLFVETYGPMTKWKKEVLALYDDLYDDLDKLEEKKD